MLKNQALLCLEPKQHQSTSLAAGIGAQLQSPLQWTAGNCVQNGLNSKAGPVLCEVVRTVRPFDSWSYAWTNWRTLRVTCTLFSSVFYSCENRLIRLRRAAARYELLQYQMQ